MHNYFHQIQTVLPYYKLMTPDWLLKHSTITKPFAVYPKYLEISGGIRDEHIQAELKAPNVLKVTDSVAVSLIIAMDAIYGTSNNQDSIFGISDGASLKQWTKTIMQVYRHVSNMKASSLMVILQA